MKKFTKVLSVFLAVILSVNTFSIGAFASVKAPAKLEFTIDNVHVIKFKAEAQQKFPEPELEFWNLAEDGTIVSKVPLIEGIHYRLMYLRFKNDNSVNMRITGVGNYFGEVETATRIEQPEHSDFIVSTDRDVAEGEGTIAPRTYTFLDKIPFSVTLPSAEGSLTFYYNGNAIGEVKDIKDRNVNFTYDSNEGKINAGPISTNSAITVEWKKAPGVTPTYFVVAGFTLKKFNLKTAKFEGIDRKPVDGKPHTPPIFLSGEKDASKSLNNNPNCTVSYYNNVNETSGTYATKAVVAGFNNFEGEASVPFELFTPTEVIPAGIAVDRPDQLYTYGDEIIMTAYVRSGANTSDTASFWVVHEKLGDAKILLGTAKVSYIGNNGTSILKYQTSGKELKVYNSADEDTKNTIVVTFDSGEAAKVDGVMMRPKPLEMNIQCKDRVYAPGEYKAEIPIGPGAKNYTFVGRLLLDDIRVKDADIGFAQFCTDMDNLVPTDYYAGVGKPVTATGFTVTGIHKDYYIYPKYAHGTATISKRLDPTLFVATNPADLSTYVISSDEGEFVLDGASKIILENTDKDKHIGDLSFKVTNVIDIDRGGIFEKKPEAVGNALKYKAKDIEIETPAHTASCMLTISSTNYTDINTNINFTLIAKKWANIGGFSIDSKVYDGVAAVLNGKAAITSQDGGLLISTKELVVNYTSADGGTYSAATPPILPGKYYAVITLPKTAYGYYGKTVLPFTIEKATVNISTPSFEIYQGQASLPEIPITYTGFVNKETVAVFTTNTLKAAHSTPDTLLPGKFVVKFDGEIVSDKYNFTYSPGTLTIVKVAKYPAVDPIPEKVSGISVFVPKKSLPDKITSFEELALSINVVEPADDRIITQVMQQKTGFKNYKKMDIKLIEVVSGNAVQPKGKVTISFPYPDGSDSTMNFKVLHLFKNSTKIEMIIPTKVVGGIQFQVSEFSPFIIGWEPNIKSEDTDFYITNAQITTDKNSFSIAVREDARKASFALTKFFEESNDDKSVTFKNPDVIISFDKNAVSIKEVRSSYDFYAVKDNCEHELAARAAAGEAAISVVHFNYQGYWPGIAQVSINVGKERKGEELAYYYYNPETEKLEYSTKATVDKDGWFTVDQDHCSDYVISSEFPKIIPSPSPTPEPTPAPVVEEPKSNIFTKIWDFIKGIPKFIMGIPKLIMGIPAFIMALPENFGKFVSTVKTTFGNIASTVSNIFGNVTGFLGKLFKPVANIFGKITNAVGGFIGGITDKVGAIFGGVKDEVGDTVDGVKEGVNNGVTTVKDNIFLFIGVLVVLIMIALIVFFIIKLIKKRKGGDDDDEDNAEGKGDETADSTGEEASEPVAETQKLKKPTSPGDDIEY